MRFAALLFVACLSAGPVLAQEHNPATHIQQMDPTAPARDAAEARQIGAPTVRLRPMLVDAAPDRAVGAPPAATTPDATLDQVSREGPTADPVSQLASADADPGPAPSAEQRAQGRVTAVSRPDGPDRCDPQSPRPPSTACDRVIEARAGEFSSPDFQPLSAEQRLLATERQQRRTESDPASAARRLANGEFDESNAALAVASMTMGLPAEEEKQPAPTASSTAIDAIVVGITTLVTGAPPNP